MNRMTQFKEKAGKDRENASLGLYAYPALMAADILIYKATHCAGRRGPEAAPRADARHRPEVQQRLQRARLLPAHRAVDLRRGDARHEPARRHQEDEQVRSVGLSRASTSPTMPTPSP
jgi:hypothetical protein